MCGDALPRKRDTLDARESRPSLCWPEKWQVDTSDKSPALIQHCNFSELAPDNIASCVAEVRRMKITSHR
jgi:hypothetical protein